MAFRPEGPLTAFRIADRRHPIFDGTGAFLMGGRWNSPGRLVIYASATYAGALLEMLAHANLGRVPKTHSYIEIQIPEGIPTQHADLSHLPDWDGPDLTGTRKIGDQWLKERKAAVLIVPSVATRGLESNILLNPAHPDFGRVTATEPQPVRWDPRLVKD